MLLVWNVIGNVGHTLSPHVCAFIDFYFHALDLKAQKQAVVYHTSLPVSQPVRCNIEMKLFNLSEMSLSVCVHMMYGKIRVQM